MSVRVVRASALAAGVFAIIGSASAADIYGGGGYGGYKDAPIIVAAPAWTGFYVGGHLGAAWTNLETRRNTYWDRDPLPTGVAAAPYDYSTFGGNGLGTTGAFGGGQFGYNWQTGGNFVLGIEVDVGGLQGDNERTFAAATYDGPALDAIDHIAVVNVKSQGGIYGDVTGRLGYAWGNTLLYLKGGFAWLATDLKVRAAITDIDGETDYYNRSFDNTLTGWTAGGGLEYQFNPNWTMKVEYLHFDFSLDDNNWRWDEGNNWKIFKNDVTADTVKLGFNYRFVSSPAAYVPLK
ncbi:porin [Rhodomicrobium vannielii ATCC 17100]|uniref:Porin n=1 Tax=Rhodomicrobium vannielii (strain ATCC 17100 / DSM 162 / LMG 4299 / NCIMB 10020 / ATH 3.1.1) TaxID=648757 RepID=E3I253_RHOVT|nr:outer membrane beta-barrel protein [Rhodomicrobium vannielii]ADP72440.1 porin [Rhodomicrobium vannielii ATCC 17100]